MNVIRKLPYLVPNPPMATSRSWEQGTGPSGVGGSAADTLQIPDYSMDQ